MSDTHAAHAGEHVDHPQVPYFVIFASLVVFTGITIGASFVDLHTKTANVLLAIAIAAFKASLVMIFFMHLKYEKRPIVLIALAPFALVVILITALLPDIANGQYHMDDSEVKALQAKEHAEKK